MRINRHILRHEWEDVRADIERVIKEEELTPTEFRPLGVYDDWAAIEENIHQTFCKLSHPTARPSWLWNNFRHDSEAFTPNHPWEQLLKLIDPAETVWFFTQGNRDKLWFYQGTIDAIVKVFVESYYIDELYVASKKYEWLVCINHHDVLIATGGAMPDRLRQLKIASN